MIALTLRTMAGRGRRVLLTLLIATVGVGAVTGTLVFTDTIYSSLHRLYGGVAECAQILVTGRQTIASNPAAGAEVPASLLSRIRSVAGVAAAAGQISDAATIVGRDGRPLSPGRLPTLALSYPPPPFRGISILRGAPPAGPNEVAVDEATADQQGYRIGEELPVVTGQPLRRFRITGIAGVSGAGSAATPGQRFVVFDTATAQSLFGKSGVYDTVQVALAQGTPVAQAAGAIQRLLPAGLIARSRRARVDAEVAGASSRLQSLTTGLFAFAAVAALVGALLVFNGFAASATRRAGELALLRALGATRLQTFGANLFEAGLLGLFASLLGVAAGVGVALLIRVLFDPTLAGLAQAPLVISWRTVWIGLAVGIGVAMLAATMPAARAARAAPLEAVRAAALSRRPHRVMVRAALAAVLGLGGLAVILSAHGAAGQRLRISGIGAAAAILGMLVAAPLLVRGLARPMSWLLERRDPVVGRMAWDQSRQNPGRTAIAASSLTIGLALVLVVSAYAGAVRRASRIAVQQAFVGDAVVRSEDPSSTIPAAVAQATTRVPGVLALASLRQARANLAEASGVQVSGIDPVAWSEVYRFHWVRGSTRTLGQLGVGEILLEQDTARAAGLSLGQHADLSTGSGRRVPVTVSGIYRDVGLLHGAVVSSPWFSQLFNQPRLQAVFLRLAPGSDRARAMTALRSALRQFPGVVARSRSGVVAEFEPGTSTTIDLLYGLLILSLIMSLLGIAGILNLSIHERTRELGLLRALGMGAGQARALIRDESLVAAGVGLVSGIALGVLLSWAVTRALAVEGLTFTLPWVGVLAALAVGIAAGSLAAVVPARRVARLDVLAAIAHE